MDSISTDLPVLTVYALAEGCHGLYCSGTGDFEKTEATSFR
jgi:hypothetical protein